MRLVMQEAWKRERFLLNLADALPGLTVDSLHPGRKPDGSGVWNLLVREGNVMHSLQAVLRPGQEMCSKDTLDELAARVRRYFQKRHAPRY